MSALNGHFGGLASKTRRDVSDSFDFSVFIRILTHFEFCHNLTLFSGILATSKLTRSASSGRISKFDLPLNAPGSVLFSALRIPFDAPGSGLSIALQKKVACYAQILLWLALERQRGQMHLSMGLTEVWYL